MEDQPQHNLSDVGTRYKHLSDYRDALEFCVGIIKSKKYPATEDAKRIHKFEIALELLQVTIDSLAGINDNMSQYSLYRQVDSAACKPELIEGGRGTPLRDYNTGKY